MSNISVFNFESASSIRIVMIDDNPWFVAKDICDALGLSNHRDAISKLDKDEKGVALTDTLGGQQELSIINESGMYALVMRSRDAMKEGTPQHKFRKWVTSEVLPAIRKTGKYEAPKPVEKRDYINNSDMLNIKRLIWACTHHIGHSEAFKFGIWYSLRKVTGVPSPAKFEVQHLPILAQEFQRILNVVEPYFEARRECELALIKRVIRERGDHKVVQAILDEMKASATDFNETLQKHLPMVFDQDCLNLLNRRPNGYDHSDCNERLI
ncbi:MAG: Bro-N domain-containing protein [Acinetobacter junii]|nr:Bro-N domain-containing protein [Acinetobacter junii]